METVPLKEWTELRVQHAEKTAEARSSAADAAVAIASSQLTIRLDHANGLIAQMKEQAQEFARRAEVDLAQEGIKARLETLERSRASAEGREKGGERLTQIAMIIVGAVVGYLVSKLGGGP